MRLAPASISVLRTEPPLKEKGREKQTVSLRVRWFARAFSKFVLFLAGRASELLLEASKTPFRSFEAGRVFRGWAGISRLGGYFGVSRLGGFRHASFTQLPMQMRISNEDIQ